MSIRLRLTLLYTAILALTLAGFGITLYGSQARAVRQRDERWLAEITERIAQYRRSGHARLEDYPLSPPMPQESHQQGRSFEPRNVYIQLLSPGGDVLATSEELESLDIPLSEAGLQAALEGEPNVQTVWIAGERMLVYSKPVIRGEVVEEVIQNARPLADPDQYLSTLRRMLLISGGGAVFVAFGIGWVLAGLVLRPVDRITQTARTIGAEQDFDRRVDYNGPNDEIGQLATTFNTMLGELQAAYRQVEQSLQQQRQFVADVSHELRTPLTTIRGNLALLRRQPAISTEDKKDILDDMVDESDRLIRLVNDLLALARAEAGRELRSDPIAVKPLIEDVCSQARQIDPDRTITCAPLRDMAVVGDQDALKQVLLILVDNALKHTTGAVEITVTDTNDQGKISIRDHGPGIAPEVLPHIFERFYRGEENQSWSGLGLGLPIAQVLVEAQDGTLTVESQPGLGSVFTVTLPRLEL